MQSIIPGRTKALFCCDQAALFAYAHSIEDGRGTNSGANVKDKEVLWLHSWTFGTERFQLAFDTLLGIVQSRRVSANLLAVV